MAIHLSGLPGDAPSRGGGRAAHFPRLALLRVGFTEPVGSPRPLVRSYRTVSPLPVRARRPAIGGLLSVALSCGSPRLAVSQHPALRSPDLPRHDPATRSVPRPPGRLTVTASLPPTGGAGGRHRLGRVSRMSERRPSALRPRGSATGRSEARRGGRASESERSRPGARSGVLSIGGALRARSRRALTSAFPRNRHLWVRGEIQSFSDHAARATAIWTWSTPTTAAAGSAPPRPGCAHPEGQVLEAPRGRPCGTPGQGRGSTWPRAWSSSCGARSTSIAPKGEISFILSELDVTALLGRSGRPAGAAAAHAGGRGPARAQCRAASCPTVPLQVGLVASPGTEGYRDFLGQLTGSGFGFHVAGGAGHRAGRRAPAAVARR